MTQAPPRAPLILLSIIGIIFSFVLLYHQAEIDSGALSGPSLCAISPQFDCDTVAKSRYSKIAGIPVASFALTYYVALLGASWSAYRKPAAEKDRALVCFIILGLLPSLTYLAISLTVLKTLCLYCTVLDINIICMSIAAWRLTRPQPLSQSLRDGFAQIINFIGSVVRSGPLSVSARRSAIGLLLVLTFVYCLPDILIAKITERETGSNVGDVIAQDLFQKWLRSAPVSIELSTSTDWKDREQTKGPQDAKVVVVEFADYECPTCRDASGKVKQVLADFPGIKFVFKDFPLDKSCNRYLDHDLHQIACRAARMARCAGQQSPESYWKMNEGIFQLPFMTESSLDELPGKLGIDAGAFQACMSSSESMIGIQRDIELAHSQEILSTPTLVVNGKKLEYFHPAALRRILQHVTKLAG